MCPTCWWQVMTSCGGQVWAPLHHHHLSYHHRASPLPTAWLQGWARTTLHRDQNRQEKALIGAFSGHCSSWCEFFYSSSPRTQLFIPGLASIQCSDGLTFCIPAWCVHCTLYSTGALYNSTLYTCDHVALHHSTGCPGALARCHSAMHHITYLA